MSTRFSGGSLVTPEPSARQALRAATRAAHDEVDGLFGQFDLARRDDYRRFLHAHAAAFLPVESGLDAAGAIDVLDDWPLRRRSDLLVADLVALGESCHVDTPMTLESAAKALGALYVLEGSRLGGAMLVRQLAPDLPRAYLGTPQRPGSWRKLLETLDAKLYDQPRRTAAIDAAVQVFDRFAAAARTQMAVACP